MSDQTVPSALEVGPVHGRCDERFSRVQEVFTENFSQYGESGAGVAVWLDGECVVDLGGGMANHHDARQWMDETLTLVFSTTKGFAAATVLSLWEQGDLDIDAPIAEIWPEFAAGGKDRMTTRHVLSHQSGLAAFAERISPTECSIPGFAAARLAQQTPDWAVGEGHGYHALSYGWLLGEIVRRAVGQSLGAVFAARIAGPFALDSWIGLPPSEEFRVSRLRQKAIAELTGPDEGQRMFVGALTTRGTMTRKVFSNPRQVGIFNDPELHAAEWPAANGITTARSLASFYGLLATGQVLQPATIAAAQVVQSAGFDRVLRRDNRFGLGFRIGTTGEPFGRLIGAPGFGHPGAGGSIGFADPMTGLGFGYVMTQMHSNLSLDPRRERLIEAVYERSTKPRGPRRSPGRRRVWPR